MPYKKKARAKSGQERAPMSAAEKARYNAAWWEGFTTAVYTGQPLGEAKTEDEAEAIAAAMDGEDDLTAETASGKHRGAYVNGHKRGMQARALYKLGKLRDIESALAGDGILGETAADVGRAVGRLAGGDLGGTLEAAWDAGTGSAAPSASWTLF